MNEGRNGGSEFTKSGKRQRKIKKFDQPSRLKKYLLKDEQSCMACKNVNSDNFKVIVNACCLTLNCYDLTH